LIVPKGCCGEGAGAPGKPCEGADGRLGASAKTLHILVVLTSGSVEMADIGKAYGGRSPGDGGQWSLQDAKARFSEVVRRARERGPQRVTLHGRDAVVVIAAEDYDRQQARHTGRRLVETMAASPLGELDFDRREVWGEVRDPEV
jgi:antitoxin Phd